MTLEKIKLYVEKNKGVFHHFRYKGARNQNDEFQGFINALYGAIFTIEASDSRLRSFCYSDLLIGDLEIID